MTSPPPAYSDEDDPPPYTLPRYATMPGNRVLQLQIQPSGVHNNTRVPVVDRVYTYTPKVTLCDYLEDPFDAIISNINLINSIKGLVDVLQGQQKLPWRFRLQVAYKLNLLLYYFVNFIYQIIACAVEGKNIGYYVIFIIISFLGLVCEACEVIYKYRVWNHDQHQATRVADASSTTPREAWTAETQASRIQSPNPQMSFKQKARSVVIEYILHSIGEFVLLPSLICSLYGFINEKSWTFDNGIAGFNFLLFLYSIGMDAFYVKFYFIWLVQKVIRMSYKTYDELQDESENSRTKSSKYCSPVYMMVLFAISMTLLQWIMFVIIGVRIYVDNFSVYRGISDSDHEPNKGKYASSSYTRFMISYSIYSPVASCIAYLSLNKYWFYQVYSFIKQFSDREVSTQSISVPVKLISFVVDPVAYTSATVLMLSFIAFTIGIFLPDYDNSKYDIQSARISISILGILYIAVFLLSNLQAAVVFSVVVVVVAVIVAIIGIVLAVVLAVIAIVFAICVIVGVVAVLGLMIYGLILCYDN